MLSGATTLTDTLRLDDGERLSSVRLDRDVRSFFQGNRFLLEPLVRHVVSHVGNGPVVDLYAGVGLFGLSCAAANGGPVILVEGDLISSADLHRNAATFGDMVHVERRSVEAFVRSARFAGGTTVIVDPPRTGMTRDAVQGIIRGGPVRVIYVSCDVATLARDARLLVDAGYELREVSGMDLFPNTAHIETIAVFTSGS